MCSSTEGIVRDRRLRKQGLGKPTCEQLLKKTIILCRMWDCPRHTRDERTVSDGLVRHKNTLPPILGYGTLMWRMLPHRECLQYMLCPCAFMPI